MDSPPSVDGVPPTPQIAWACERETMNLPDISPLRCDVTCSFV